MNLPNYLHALRPLGCEIRVLMTSSATAILPAATVALVASQVFTDGEHAFEPGHVALAVWADQIVVLPATAHVLGQAAHGMAGNLLASTLLAFEHPVVFFPSMNWRMWGNAAVQRNVARLRGDGHLVVEPEEETCWEIATSTLVKAPGVPSPTRAAEVVAAALAVSRDCGPGLDPRRGRQGRASAR